LRGSQLAARERSTLIDTDHTPLNLTQCGRVCVQAVPFQSLPPDHDDVDDDHDDVLCLHFCGFQPHRLLQQIQTKRII